MTSIRLRLLKWLIGPILLINLAGASLTYMLAWLPAQLAFDQSLADASGALAARLQLGGGAAAVDLPRQAEQILRANDVDAFYFVVRSAGGRMLAGDADFPAPRPGEQAAYDDSMRGEPIRVAFRTAVAGDEEIRIGVAKTMRKRLQIRSAVVRAAYLEIPFSRHRARHEALDYFDWYAAVTGPTVVIPDQRTAITIRPRHHGLVGHVCPHAIEFDFVMTSWLVLRLPVTRFDVRRV